MYPFNNRIFEETARAADLLHVGELGIADGTDGVVELLQSRTLNAVLLQIGFDVAVFEVERRVFGADLASERRCGAR